MGEGDHPTKEGELTVLSFAVGKTKEELLVVQQQAERMLQRYEAGLRIAATVLSERGHFGRASGNVRLAPRANTRVRPSDAAVIF
jgi:hypothetical protein